MTNHYFITCPVCGREIDCRDLNDVVSHANWSEEKQQYVCMFGEPILYSSSRLVGEAVEWMEGKEPINLN